MRKISVLQENYMALEQSIAYAIDGAEKGLDEVEKEAAEITQKAMEGIQNTTSPHLDPSIINFKAESGIDKTIAEIEESLGELAKKFKSMNSVSLGTSAYLSKVSDKLRDFERDQSDEVYQVVSFFGPKDNSDIPDSDNEAFSVSISDLGRKEAIQRVIEIRELFEEIKANIYNFINEGKNKEDFMTAIKKLAILKDLVSKLLAKE